ncbi:MAG: PAS domain S-box protein [Methylocella sp.]
MSLSPEESDLVRLLGRGHSLPAGAHAGTALRDGVIPANEPERLAAVRRYDILDTPPDGACDRITAIAARLFNVPISIISVVDHDRIWFKSRHGVSVTEIGRDPGLCASVTLRGEPRILPDAKLDLHALANPLVAGEFGLRFYAGVPLRTSDGFNLGTLCVIDKEPREVSAEEIALLEDLASLVMDQLELRLQARAGLAAKDALVEELRHSQEQLNIALTASGTGTFRWNPHTGEFLAFDNNLKRLFGFASGEPVRDTEDLIGRVHPDDVPRLVAAINRCRKGADFEMEFRVVHPDGTIHWLSDRAKMERDAEGNPTYLVGACTDVTQRTESEYAARETAQRFLFMAETMPQKIFTATASGDVDYLNQQWKVFTGLPSNQIRDWGWTQLVHPDDVEENIRRWRHSIETGEPFEFTHRFRRADGAYRWHLSRARAMRDGSGAIAMWVGSNTEIHEQKEMAEALRESEERLSAELAAAQLLQRISTELVHEQNVQSFYAKLVDAAARIMCSDCASIQLLHPERDDRGELHLLAAHGFSPQAAKFWERVRADSACTCGMALRTRERAIATNVETCDFMAGTQDRASYLEAGIHAAQSTPLLSRSGHLLGMISTHWREPHEPSETDLQRFDVLARQAADLLERAQAETALRESEERLRAIVDQTKAGIAQTDLTGRFELVNERYCEITGYSRDELLRMQMQELTHPEDLPRNLELFRRMTAEGAPFVIEKRYLRKDGSAIWVSNTVSLARDGSGRPQHVVAISLDISERRRAQEQQSLLLREMSHRVKNLFSLASGLVTMSARSAHTPADMAEAVRERLGALARAHGLTRPGLINGGEEACKDTTLHALVQTIFAPYVEPERIKGHGFYIVTGPSLSIGGNSVTSIALIMHELATNAVKYGALSTPGGYIHIDWSVQEGELLLIWKEHGGPSLGGQPEREGFGGSLVRRIVTGQFGGQLSYDWKPKGLIIRLSVPVERLTM